MYVNRFSRVSFRLAAWCLVGVAGIIGCQAGDGDDNLGANSDQNLEWPAEDHHATSDKWIVDHHDKLATMRPRVMLINFSNEHTESEIRLHANALVALIKRATTYHGYVDPTAKPFIVPEIKYVRDLRNKPIPAGWTYRNSTLYPREVPVEGTYGFSYSTLLGGKFAEHLGILDGTKRLTLCQASQKGLVHEVWVYGVVDEKDKNMKAAEVVGVMQRYNDALNRYEGKGSLDTCAGSGGCMDEKDTFPKECSKTLRIVWVNLERPAGCALHNYGHMIETVGTRSIVPYLRKYFSEFSGFDLEAKYGTTFRSWYDVCPYGSEKTTCLSYGQNGSLNYPIIVDGSRVRRRIDKYVPACGNVHFAPNARGQYDIVNDQSVASTCLYYRKYDRRQRRDPSSNVSAASWMSAMPEYKTDDGCQTPWVVWWMQNIPGYKNQSVADDGKPMKNWWPFLYY